MSRSKHHGCGQTCGVCKPHKKWPSKAEPKHAVQCVLQEDVPSIIKSLTPEQITKVIELETAADDADEMWGNSDK